MTPPAINQPENSPSPGNMEKKKEKLRSRNSHIPTDIIFEKILIWVPAKSLMRFKLVCKLWRSTILHDRRFHQAHHSLSHSRPSILTFIGTYDPVNWYMSNPPPIENRVPVNFTQSDFQYTPAEAARIPDVSLLLENRFLCTSISSSHSTSASWQKTVSKDYCATEVVNGLACFYSKKFGNNDIYLCNLSTSETLKLPPSPVSTVHPCPSYYLGFDQLNNVYKLLKIQQNQHVDTDCSKILTINYNQNQNRWRDITVRESIAFRKSYCFESALYWIGKDFLVRFDLNKERFSIIRYPSIWHRGPSMYNSDRPSWYDDSLEGGLAQYLGLLALTLPCVGEAELNIWLLQPNYEQRAFLAWYRIRIDFPINLWNPYPRVYVLTGSLRTRTSEISSPLTMRDKIMFTIRRNMVYKPMVGFHTPVYSYDLRSGRWEAMEEDDCYLSAVAASSSVQAAYKDHSQTYYLHEDNILPLKDILAPK